MKSSPRQQNLLTYLAVGLAAVVIRLVCLWQLQDSPLAVFHLLPGLDMESHLLLGKEFAAGNSIFTVYRFLLAWLPVGSVILIQFAAGTGTALLTGYCSFRLFGKWPYALAAGLLAALYAPALMYEMTILQESVTVFLTFAAFAALLFARKRHFALLPSLAAGLLLGLAGTGRPVGLPFVAGVIIYLVWYLRRQKKSCRRLLPYLGAFAAVWLLIGSYNAVKGWPLPFYGGNLSYLAAVGSRAEISDWNVAETPGRPLLRQTGDILAGFARKLPKLFEARELPDNLNYYFIREHFPALQKLPGPLLLFPLGTAGLLLILCRRRLFKREGLLWLYVGSLMLFVVAYYPTGRHRLILYPALAIAASHALLSFYYCRDRRQRYFGPILAVAVFAVNLIATPNPAVRRTGDDFTWGLALEKPVSRRTPSALPYFRRAAENAPQNRKYVIAYLNALIRRAEWAELRSFVLAQTSPAPIHLYYLALSRLADGEPEEAAVLFARINAAMVPELAVPYYYYFGESRRLSGHPREAESLYRQGLEQQPTAEQQAMLETALKQLVEKTAD